MVRPFLNITVGFLYIAIGAIQYTLPHHTNPSLGRQITDERINNIQQNERCDLPTHYFFTIRDLPVSALTDTIKKIVEMG